jgi:lipoprotein-anchoring transpeptidase ErfK/SrfK
MRASRTARAILQPSGIRRGGMALAAALLTAGTGSVLVDTAEAASHVPASQRLVVLLHDHVARTAPRLGARRIEAVRARRPLTRARTVLPVLGYTTVSGRSWAHVRLPGRPNGHKGWIPTDHTRRTSTEWQISIRLSARRVTVYRGGRATRRFSAVVGKPSTPTPRGRFFVEEAVALNSSDAGGPFALATSARSNVLQEFDGGPGQIALHGTDNLSGALGTAASHGCVRLSTDAITWIARRVGAGAPLTVKR